MHRFGVTILGVLNQKYHEEGDDCRRGVYDQLPSVREMKCRASEDPDEDDEHRPAKGPGAAKHHGRMARENSECVADDTKKIRGLSVFFRLLYLSRVHRYYLGSHVM